MSWFPFVSRDRYEEATAEVKRLRDEIALEREQKQKLWNWVVWRIGGVAPDVSALPEPYQPRPAGAPAACATQTADAPTRRSPGQARREIALFEVQREGEFERDRVPIPNARRISADQIAVVQELNQAASEGQRAAGA